MLRFRPRYPSARETFSESRRWRWQWSWCSLDLRFSDQQNAELPAVPTPTHYCCYILRMIIGFTSVHASSIRASIPQSCLYSLVDGLSSLSMSFPNWAYLSSLALTHQSEDGRLQIFLVTTKVTFVRCSEKTSKRCTRTMSHVHNVWRAKKHYKDLRIGCVVMYAIVLLLCHEKASATWELKVTNRSDWLTTCCQVVFREFAVVLAMRSISTWHAPHQDLPITSPLKMTNHEVISSEPPDLLQQRSP